MEKNGKIHNKTPYSGPYNIRPKATNNYFTQKQTIREKSFLPPIVVTNTRKCPFCQNSVQKILFNSHFESHPTRILDFLYLGSFANAISSTEMQIIQTGYILNCAAECRNAFPNNYEYLKFPLVDFPNIDISRYFDDAFSFIEKARTNNSVVFVHCQMGKSRSVSIVIAYLMKYHNYSFSSAFDYVKARRKIAFPNIGFIKKLKEFDLLLKKN